MAESLTQSLSPHGSLGLLISWQTAEKTLWIKLGQREGSQPCAESLRDWQGAEQSPAGCSTGGKLVPAGPSCSLCLSPARLRCCHPCLASRPAPGMAQLPGALLASPQQGGFSSHSVLLVLSQHRGAAPSPQLCFPGCPCFPAGGRQQHGLSPGITSEATKTAGQLQSHQQIKEPPVRELSPSSASRAPSLP